ncbi:MAG: hypothetical protein WBN89_12955 [Prochlorococcaceae cyanobacterium]
MRKYLSHWDRRSRRLGRSMHQSPYHRKRATARATQVGRALPGMVVTVSRARGSRPALVLPTR